MPRSCRYIDHASNESVVKMAFVYHDHEGFRPATRSKKQKRRPLSIQDLVLRATEEVTANGDWLSECRSRLSFPTLASH